MILTPETLANVVHAPAMIETVEASHMLMDKAYGSDALRDPLQSKGMKARIPLRSNWVTPAAYDKELYKKRHRVENFFETIKRIQHNTTRYDKTDVSFRALSCSASALYPS
ncbi:hypothetical protein GCM10023213_33760 [Prosthecobacter algae]|uniref:Transposase IS4-like domain-containing protein n=1 Tax=Prosthecobacter algae TaxID=1144682 RepID=A0ABP9PDU4_9BACT